MSELWQFSVSGEKSSEIWEELKAATLPQPNPEAPHKRAEKEDDNSGNLSEASTPETIVTPSGPTLPPAQTGEDGKGNVAAEEPNEVSITESIPEIEVTPASPTFEPDLGSIPSGDYSDNFLITGASSESRGRASEPSGSSERSGSQSPSTVRVLGPIRVSKNASGSQGNQSNNTWDCQPPEFDATQLWEDLKNILPGPQPETAPENEGSGDKNAPVEKPDASVGDEAKDGPTHTPNSEPFPSNKEAVSSRTWPGKKVEEVAWVDVILTVLQSAIDRQEVLNTEGSGNDSPVEASTKFSTANWTSSGRDALPLSPGTSNPVISWDFWADGQEDNIEFGGDFDAGFTDLSYPMAYNYTPPADGGLASCGYQAGDWRDDVPYEALNEGPGSGSGGDTTRINYGWDEGVSSDGGFDGKDAEAGQ